MDVVEPFMEVSEVIEAVTKIIVIIVKIVKELAIELTEAVVIIPGKTKEITEIFIYNGSKTQFMVTNFTYRYDLM